MARPLVRDEEGLSTFWSFVGVLVLVIAILAVYFVYVIPKFGHPPLRAQSGDQVKVDYVGRFEDGFVFDTSLASVAEDNASYTKAFSFGWRNSWQPLSFAIGAVPLAVIQGFDVGVQGLAVGDAKTIVVPPNLGYGLSDPTKILMKPLFEPVPVRVTMNESAFTNTYKTQPVSGANVTDPFWGWSAYVSVSGSIVTVTNSPVPGQMVHPYGSWAARVDSVDDGADNGTGRIVVHHLLDTTAVDRVGQKTASGTVVFVVTAVDLPGTTILYAHDRRILVRVRAKHRRLEAGRRRWTEFLGVPDERAILLCRIAPVVPFLGGFIATLRWNYRRSMGFVAVGGLAKYAVLLYLVFVIGVAYDPRTARSITLVLVVVVVAMSVLGSWLYRRRGRGRKAR